MVWGGAKKFIPSPRPGPTVGGVGAWPDGLIDRRSLSVRTSKGLCTTTAPAVGIAGPRRSGKGIGLEAKEKRGWAGSLWASVSPS